MYHIRLYKLREDTYGDNKVKHRDLAKYVGIALNTYRTYESENAIFPIKHLNKVCEFYRVSLDYIFGFTNEVNYPNNNYQIDIEKSRKRIRLLRTNLGLMTKELAKILGCTSSNINDYETGRAIINTKKLYKLCKTYSVSADYLLGKIDEPKRIDFGNGKEINIIWHDYDTDKYEYSKMLRALRKEKNLTRNDVAKVLNIEAGSYPQYEAGRVIIPIKHLDALSIYFDVSIDYILGLSDIRHYKNSRNIDPLLSGKRIKEIRKSLGFTQEVLAKDLEIPRSTLKGYETGRYIVPTHLLYKLCEKFNISADYLLGKVDEPSEIDIKE